MLAAGGDTRRFASELATEDRASGSGFHPGQAEALLGRGAIR